MKKNFILALIGIGIGGIGFSLITPVSIILLGPIIGSGMIEVHKLYGFWFFASILCLGASITFLFLKRTWPQKFIS